MSKIVKFDDGEFEVGKCDYFHSERYALYEVNTEEYKGTKSEFIIKFKDEVIGVVPPQTKVIILRETRGDDDNDGITLLIKKKEKIGYVYLVKLDKHYKIGISKSPNDRLKEFTLLPYELETVLIEKVKGYDKREKELHEHFANKRVRGEWFELNEEDVVYIKQYLKNYEVQ